MQLKTKSVLFVCSAIILLASCKKVDAGEGIQTEKRFEIADFDKIVYSTVGKLTYTQSDSDRYVTVKTNQDMFEILDVYVENGILYIETEDNYSIKNGDQMIITVFDDDVNDIVASGSGNVTANFDETYNFDGHSLSCSGSGNINANEVHSQSQNLSTSGSGSINLSALYTEVTTVKISGSGGITTSGNTNESNVTMTGSGSFKAFSFFTYHTNITNSSSGNAEISVDSWLDCQISGSGNVYYKGSPIIVSSSTGSGKLIDAN
ncbi:DUF2807 domain-containing protein [Paracrocinitomix mangrovi]|uniref:GIN domain-containing protein n=1 Tax=Paracrocinitomix mangrovi TaxID=2862509 RepID=UPI001C8D589B|nr:DUF2807 domain-containing protein [Paracrocinitomix mangrovi]UKN01593.1 DUF2807 domain-containing protein [Paracrocinitomix mangrovi]